MSAFSKAFLLLSCTFLGLICGTLYLYSSYSPQFATRLNYSATDSSRIALFGTIGVAVAGPIAGKLVDQRGYTLSLLLGGVCVIGSYYGLKRQFDSGYSSVHLSSLLIFVIGCGSTFMNSACLKCCAVSFPSIRGVATSLPLALYGLSALFYSVIAALFFLGNTSEFLGFLSYSSAIIFLICTPSIMICDIEHGKRRTRKERAARATNQKQDIELSTILTPSASSGSPSSSSSSSSPSSSSSEEVGGLALLSNRNFWIIFFITGSLASLGQMYIYSVGYVVKALVSFGHVSATVKLDPTSQLQINSLIQKSQLFQVGLLSVANCIGRIVLGILGDMVLQQFNKPRSMLLYIPAFGMMATQIMGFTFTQYSNLSLLSLLTGFFYGFTFCIMPLIVGDAFGMENYSLNWGFVGLAPILPSFYFTQLFGKTYDINSIVLESTGAQACVSGRDCYSSVFHVTFLVTITSIAAVIALTLRKRVIVNEKK